PASEPLTSESYTAVAEQTEFEILGGIFETATTEPVTFTVDTQPPEVEITKGPESRSNNVKPTFEGTASENTEVVVHVKLGTTEVASGPTTAAAGKWSISTLNKRLPAANNKLTAYATEKSGIGNLDGKSEPPGSIEVDTPPTTLFRTKGPEPRSNNVKPTFEGTASENTEVVVHIKLGTTEVANGSTTAAAGKWSISTLNKALPPGNNKFTAYATEKSGIGNREGESNEEDIEELQPQPNVACR